jgi:superfamily II DNA/RNA helicase
VVTVYGGTGYGPQRSALRRGVEVLVACPGRLEDLIQQNDVVLSDVKIVVLDEADRMADMGFLPAVKRLLDQTNADRQTMLFSATLDGDVDVVVKRYLNNPSRHSVASTAQEQGDVTHLFWRAERHDRVDITARLIHHHGSAIVFCRTRHGADRVTKQLARVGVEAAPIHGSRSQPQRDRALQAFSSGRVKALIATDVAARGIHVDDVSCVVHFDPPTTDKDYVHRSGRTGRAGADGMVISLVGSENAKAVRDLQRALRLPIQVDHPDAELVGVLPKRTPRPEAVPPSRNEGFRRPRRQGGRRGQTR